MSARPAKVKITWNDILASRAASDGRRDGLTEAAGMLLEASNQIVPLDTGGLLGSGAVDFDLREGTASVYYDTVYAARLHQNPKFHFQNGRRGKYLQTAVRQGRDRVMERYARGYRLRFGTGRAPGGGHTGV